MSEVIIFRHREIPDIHELDVYLAHGGFEALKNTVLQKTPQEVVDIVRASNLRGRGGAGFPAGVKWGFLTPDVFPRYVVANADESEPGTFKDREIMERNPYQFLEGVAICCYAAQAELAYVYCRGEFWDLAHALEKNIAELRARGLLGNGLFGRPVNINIEVHLGAGAYICGEETALLESLEGKIGQPRLRPPFPAAEGLYGKPTVVNNVETLSNLPAILTRGADWYRSIGTEQSSGTKIFCLSGNVVRPGNYELPFGTTFRQLIFEHGGGIPDGKAIKAILPAGASSPIMPATDEVLDTPMAYETMDHVGSSIGSASVIVVDDSFDIAWVSRKITEFFKHESCGKCAPCREGTYWMLHILERITDARAEHGDLELLETVSHSIQGKCLCALGEFAAMQVEADVKRFKADFEAYTTDGR